MKVDIILKYFSLVIFLLLIFYNVKIISGTGTLEVLATEKISENSIEKNKTKEFKNKIFPYFGPRIINGIPAKIQGNEHIVSIRNKEIEKDGFGKGHYCGGSLIGPDKVITAAHCVISPDGIRLRPSHLVTVFGITDRFKLEGAHQRNIKSIVAHRKYSRSSAKNDIALIFLKEPFNVSLIENVKIIQYANESNYYDGQEARVAGWGITENAESSRILLTVNVNIINRMKCRQAYASRFHDITSAMICAGDVGKDSCGGDSGGPFIINDVLYGIVSFGIGCANPDFPGIYTDVAYYKEWIEQNSGNTIILNITLFLTVVILQFLNLISIQYRL